MVSGAMCIGNLFLCCWVVAHNANIPQLAISFTGVLTETAHSFPNCSDLNNHTETMLITTLAKSLGVFLASSYILN